VEQKASPPEPTDRTRNSFDLDFGVVRVGYEKEKRRKKNPYGARLGKAETESQLAGGWEDWNLQVIAENRGPREAPRVSNCAWKRK